MSKVEVTSAHPICNCPLSLSGPRAAATENSNPLMHTYDMPAPIVKDPSKLDDYNLPPAYVYDVSTHAGEDYTFISHID